MKVLYLSAWYPTERDQMAGLFVQKHVEAVRAQGAEVRVLYTEEKGWRYWRTMCRKWQALRNEGWRPDIIQMNVLDKNGVWAWLLWKIYHIPYIIVEHWSGYLPANFSFKGGWHGWLMRKIAKEAKCILPVSQILEDAMKKCGIQNNQWERIHNVVDDFFYEETSKGSRSGRESETVWLLHVSCFDEKAKNTQGILRAYQQALASRPNLHLTMVGAGIDWQQSKDYAAQIGLTEKQVRWTGELTPREVCHEMQQADCFVLFSNYETYAIVIVEALISGLPIISSPVGIALEVVTNDNGILVPMGDEQALTQAMIQFDTTKYDTHTIRQQGEAYRFSTIGKQLMTIYDRAIQS